LSRLGPKLFHIWKSRSAERVGMGPFKLRSDQLQQTDLGVNFFLFNFIQCSEPLIKFFGRFDGPH
jgi:hypothetical protein